MGDAGLDTLGVPLFDKEKMMNIWETQRKHVACIQWGTMKEFYG